jgi:23S rRNA pseudouridine2605 synthase
MARAPAGERLQKVLSHLGLGSRREAEQWIRAGRVSVNGRAAVLGERVGADDKLRLDGRLIRQNRDKRERPVLLCHRSPAQPLLPGAAGMESMAAGLPRRAGQRFISVSPMPQVDGGLELLTADGELAGRLQRAVRTQLVVFSLRIRGELSEAQEAGVLAGELDRGSTLKVLSISAAGGTGSNHWYQIDTIGASGNDLRQLLERQGVTVSRLLRIRLGSLLLERSLPRGRSRELSAEEIAALLTPSLPPAAQAPDSPGSGP